MTTVEFEAKVLRKLSGLTIGINQILAELASIRKLYEVALASSQEQQARAGYEKYMKERGRK